MSNPATQVTTICIDTFYKTDPAVIFVKIVQVSTTVFALIAFLKRRHSTGIAFTGSVIICQWYLGNIAYHKLNEKHGKLNEEHGKLNADYGKLNADYGRLNSELEETNKVYKDLNTEHAKTVEDLQTVGNNLLTTNQDLANTQEKYDNLHKYYNNLYADFSDTVNKLKISDQTLAEKNEEYNDLNTEHAKTVGDLKSTHQILIEKFNIYVQEQQEANAKLSQLIDESCMQLLAETISSITALSKSFDVNNRLVNNGTISTAAKLEANRILNDYQRLNDRDNATLEEYKKLCPQEVIDKLTKINDLNLSREYLTASDTILDQMQHIQSNVEQLKNTLSLPKA